MEFKLSDKKKCFSEDSDCVDVYDIKEFVRLLKKKILGSTEVRYLQTHQKTGVFDIIDELTGEL